MPVISVSQALVERELAGPVDVEVEDGRISSIRGASGPVTDRLLVPGFVDLQVNGHHDVDVSTAAGSDWERMDALLLAQGVTTWCPTLVTSPRAATEEALARIAVAAARPAAGRPAIAGVHLEGPFLGGAPGAHRREWILPPDLAWLAALPELVRVVTLAPEVPGAGDAIAALARRDVVVALGHSTATAEQARAGIDAGARLVTHLFNGMGPLHHREPGLAGAALADRRVVCSIIADFVHVHPVALALAFRAKGPGGMALVTDAVAWAAGGHAGFAVRLGDDGAPRLADGTLAGSALTMDAAIRNAVAAGVDLPAALIAATSTPAGVLGLGDRGVLRVGARGDLVALDAALGVAEVWVGGEQAR